jgi:HlyD family secretion protein
MMDIATSPEALVTTPPVPTPEPPLDEFLGVKSKSLWQKYRNWALLALAVIVVLFAAWWLFGRSSNAPAYATQPATRGDLVVKVSATGNLAPTNQVAVGSELSGLVVSVSVDVNDRVLKGQLLAQIDTSRLLDTQARSRAALTSAQASVGLALATVQQTRANLARLQQVYGLSGGKVPSLTELDTGRADAARAQANLRVAQASVSSAEAQLSSDNTNLRKASIRSPVTGVVLSRQVEPGQTVAASFNTPTLFTIAEDLSAMELQVKVDEADVGQVKQGQTANFTVDAWPGQSFSALIKRVDVGANSTTSTAGSSSSAVVSYNAVLTVQNPDLILRPGMTATAEIVTNQVRGALLIPNAALRFKPPSTAKKPTAFGMSMGPQRRSRTKQATIANGTQQSIYVQQADGSLRAVLVTTGPSNGTLTVVTARDLKVGDLVVTGSLAAAK